MAETKISDLTADTPATGDELAFHDVSGGDTNKASIADLLNIAHTVTAGWTFTADTAIDASLKVGGTGAANETVDVVGKALIGDQGVTTAAAALHVHGGIELLRLERADGTGDNEFRFLISSSSLFMEPQDAEGDFNFRNLANNTLLQVDGSAGAVQITTPNSSTGTGLVVSGSGLNEIQRDSSSARLKKDTEVLDVDPQAVLAIQPRHGLMKADDAPWAGFIAEDWTGISEQIDKGLAWEEDGRVAGFQAGSRVIDAAQQIALRDHEERIRRLEERL